MKSQMRINKIKRASKRKKIIEDQSLDSKKLLFDLNEISKTEKFELQDFKKAEKIKLKALEEEIEKVNQLT